MAILDDVLNALESSGTMLKADLWRPDDAAFLKARAQDLVGLASKAKAQTEPAKRAAYLAAARDTVTSVKLLALIRLEASAPHILDALGKFIVSVAVPALVKLLPELAGIQDTQASTSSTRLAANTEMA